MTTELIQNKKFTLTRFWAGKEVQYQITQRYTSKNEDTWVRNIFGYVHLSKKDMVKILRKIEKDEKVL